MLHALVSENKFIYRYAYGTHGLGEILPPDSDTVIELELLGINGKKLTKKYKDDL